MNNLAKRAMLAMPNISVWTARRYDREVSEEVAKDHNADVERAGRYNKVLINVRSPEYQNVVKAAGAARRYHESRTLPWAQDGARILSAAMFDEYQREMVKHREGFGHAVTELVREYPRLVEEQKQIVNGLFKPSDYPKQEELSRKFGFHIGIYPVPSADDFRVALDNDDVEAIRAKIEMEVEDTVKSAERERWERLMRVVAHAVERLSNPENRFQDSLIGNIQTAVEVLPKLALRDDPGFDEVLADVRQKLTVLDPKELRDEKNRKLRKAAAHEAAEIVRKMKGFMPQ